MKAVGTICEYNPFHNGHLYQLEQIRAQNPDSVIIVCLSTYYTMRGDLSVHLPKVKASYALNKADIVVALPSVLAVNSADNFAKNSVNELAKLQVSAIYCGSESNDLEYIKNINFAEDDIKDKLNAHLPYKKATAQAIDIKPNDLLAYCYYKSIKNTNIDLKLIKRVGSLHHEDSPNHQVFTSSQAIRNNFNLISQYCPSYVSPNLIDEELLFPFFKFMLLNYNNFADLMFIRDGIEKHILNNLKLANSFKELYLRCSNSYFTTSKIKRACFYLLYNIEKINLKYPYSYILGFNEKGRNYLNEIKKTSQIITNNKLGLSKILDYEIKIANILDSIYHNKLLSLELGKPIMP